MAERLFTVHDLFLVVAIVECVLVVLARLLLPSKNPAENYLLGFFMGIIGVNAFTTLLMWNTALELPWFFPLELVVTVSLLTHIIRGPALYLYIKSLTLPDFELTKQHLIHLVPMLLLVLALVVWALISDQGFGRDSPEWAWHVGKIVSLSYTAGFAWLVYQYRQRLKEGFSAFSETESVWLYCLSVGFFINWSWALVVGLSKEFSPDAPDILGPVQNYIYFFVMNALFIYILVYANRLLKLQPYAGLESTKDNVAEDVVDIVLSGVQRHKLHLQPSITIEEYAAKVNLPVRSVSNVLNQHKGTNFFEFINSHRIEHAKALLASPEYAGTSILDVLLESGFNNKSSFHRFFKRLVGVLPSEYRRKALRELKTKSSSAKE